MGVAAVALRLRRDGLRHEQLDDGRRPGRPVRARDDAAARRGRAAPAGAPGLRREQLGEAVRAQHRDAASRCATRTPPRACAAPPTAGASTSRRSPAASPTRSPQDGAARALNPSLVPQRASFRAPFRDPAAGRAGARRYGVAFMWSPRLLLWRTTIRKHAPGDVGAALVEEQGAARTRRARGHAAPDRRCRRRAARARPRARDRRPLRARREPVHRRGRADEAAAGARRRALAARRATRSTRSTAASSTSARATGTRRSRSASRTSTSASRSRARARRARSTSGCSAPARPIPAARTAGSATPRSARVQAQVARYFGATPVNGDACGLLGQAACRAVHARRAARVPASASRSATRPSRTAAAGAAACRSRAGSRPGARCAAARPRSMAHAASRLHCAA